MTPSVYAIPPEIRSITPVLLKTSHRVFIEIIISQPSARYMTTSIPFVFSKIVRVSGIIVATTTHATAKITQPRTGFTGLITSSANGVIVPAIIGYIIE